MQDISPTDSATGLAVRSDAPPRPYLVFTSAGRHANLSHWLPGRNFDLWVTYYGPGENPYARVAEIHHSRSGSKFQNLAFAYRQWRDLLARYRAIMVMDDDVLISGAAISRLFELREELGLWLLQPAFHPRGKISHPITEVRPWLRLRYTSFVEMTCPLFARDKLFDFLEVYDPALVGFGMDWWFLHTLGPAAEGRVAIVDEVTCVNPRDAAKGGRREIDRLQSEEERRRIWNEIKAKYRITSESRGQVEYGRIAKPQPRKLMDTLAHCLGPYPALRRLRLAAYFLRTRSPFQSRSLSEGARSPE